MREQRDRRSVVGSRESAMSAQSATAKKELGKLHRNTGKFSEAQRLFTEAYEEFVGLGRVKDQANALMNRGILFRMMDEWAPSEADHVNANKLYVEARDPRGQADNLKNYGALYRDMGDLKRAIEIHQESLDIYEELGTKVKIAALNQQLGIDYQELGEPETARRYLERASGEDTGQVAGDQTSKPSDTDTNTTVPVPKEEVEDHESANAEMPTGPNGYVYDVAISYARPERELAETLATAVRDEGFAVFYDNFYKEDLWGDDLAVKLDSIYRKESRFCVMLISNEYAERMWPVRERQSAQARAIEEKGKAYILPIKVHDVELDGMPPTIGYLDINDHSVDEIASILIRKLKGGT